MRGKKKREGKNWVWVWVSLNIDEKIGKTQNAQTNGYNIGDEFLKVLLNFWVWVIKRAIIKSMWFHWFVVSLLLLNLVHGSHSPLFLQYSQTKHQQSFTSGQAYNEKGYPFR